jgi:hypothetical protein
VRKMTLDAKNGVRLIKGRATRNREAAAKKQVRQSKV